MKPRFLSLCCAVLALNFGACQILTERPTLAALAVKAGTYEFVKKHPNRAERVIELANFIEANGGNETYATVALLEAAIVDKIHWDDYSYPVQEALRELIALVREELVARLGDGVLSEEQRLQVKQVAGWMREAAEAATRA